MAVKKEKEIMTVKQVVEYLQYYKKSEVNK